MPGGGINQPGMLFIGTIRDQERKYIKKFITAAKTKGYMDIEWKEVSFLFLSAQYDKFKELVSAIGKKDMLGVAETDQFKPFIDALGKYQKYSDIHSVGMAVDQLTKKALEEITDSGYTGDGQWQTIASCIGGGGSIPKEEASTLKKAIEEMIKAGLIDKKKKWKGLILLADYYLKRGETEEKTE